MNLIAVEVNTNSSNLSLDGAEAKLSWPTQRPDDR